MKSVYDNLTIGAVAAVFNTGSSIVVTSPSVDTKGYNSAAIRVSTSAVGAAILAANQVSLVAVLQESNDDGVADAYASAVDNTGATIKVQPLATTSVVLASARVEGLGLNRKRYLRLSITGGTPTAGVIVQACTAVAVIELGRAYNNPVTTTNSNT